MNRESSGRCVSFVRNMTKHNAFDLSQSYHVQTELLTPVLPTFPAFLISVKDIDHYPTQKPGACPRFSKRSKSDLSFSLTKPSYQSITISQPCYFHKTSQIHRFLSMSSHSLIEVITVTHLDCLENPFIVLTLYSARCLFLQSSPGCIQFNYCSFTTVLQIR